MSSPSTLGAITFEGGTPLTVSVFSDSASPLPAMFFASTFTRSVWPTSAAATVYVASTEGAAACVHDAPAVLQRSHSYSNTIGSVPLHLPLEAVSSCPAVAVPEIDGASVLLGPTPVTSSVVADSFSTAPATFFAVTTTR